VAGVSTLSILCGFAALSEFRRQSAVVQSCINSSSHFNPLDSAIPARMTLQLCTLFRLTRDATKQFDLVEDSFPQAVPKANNSVKA
jgi:hypothetical protein